MERFVQLFFGAILPIDDSSSASISVHMCVVDRLNRRPDEVRKGRRTSVVLRVSTRLRRRRRSGRVLRPPPLLRPETAATSLRAPPPATAPSMRRRLTLSATSSSSSTATYRRAVPCHWPGAEAVVRRAALVPSSGMCPKS